MGEETDKDSMVDNFEDEMEVNKKKEKKSKKDKKGKKSKDKESKSSDDEKKEKKDKKKSKKDKKDKNQKESDKDMLGQLEADVLSKQKCRLSPTSSPSKPGAHSVSNNDGGAATATALGSLEADIVAKTRASGSSPPASAPGVVSVSNNASSSLEDRIQAKIRGENSKPAASRPGAQPAAASLEDRISAKIRGENNNKNTEAAASKPGAHSEQSSSMEDRIAAKVRSSSGAVAPGAQSGLKSLEDSVLAKVRAEDSEPAAVASKPGAHSEQSSSLEDRISAKVRSSSAATPGAQAGIQSLEDSVMAKVRSSGGPSPAAAAAPGARAELSNLEDRVAAKVRRDGDTPGAHSELKNLDDRVSAKVRGESKPAASSPGAQAELQNLEDQVSAKVRREDSAQSGKENENSRVTPRSLKELEDMDDDELFANLDARIAAKTASFAPKKKNDDTSKKQAYDSDSKDQAPSFIKGDGDRSLQPSNGITTTADHGIIREPDVEFGMLIDNPEGLAVAVAIEEEDDDLFIPAAVEYDPDAKPPIYKNRRFRLYACLAFVVIIVVAVGAAVGETKAKVMPIPTAAPTAFRESFGIKDAVRGVVGSWALRDPESPYSKALDWITFDDPLQLTAEDSNLIQRFIAAYVYFATTVKGPWRTCNPPEDPWNDSPRCGFDKFKSERPLIEWAYTTNPASSWLSNSTECNWAGVSCDDQGQITGLSLPGTNLTGNFPEGIYRWPFLSAVNFFVNELKGPLPSRLGQMPHLGSLRLGYNSFEGTIPEEWWSLRQLVEVDVGNNNGITGTLPTEVGNLLDLHFLWLGDNKLTGTIPSEFGLLDQLVDVDLGRNQFTGTIPDTFQRWVNLDELWLNGNELTGPIPSIIGKMTTLAELHLDNNGLTGKIPDELYELPRLDALNLNDNGLTGTISPKIGNYGESLFHLRLSNNKFSGQIPFNFSQLTYVELVYLQGNNFTGSYPAESCALQTLDGEGKLSDLQADCAPDGNGNIQLECTCCTRCCSGGGEDCVSKVSGKN